MKNSTKQSFNWAFLSLFVAFSTLFTACSEDNSELKDDYCVQDAQAKKQMQEQIISNGDVFDFYNNYTDKRANIIRESYGGNFDDTRSVTFNYKVLKEYLRFIEEESKKLGVTPEGIKVGFGVYGEEDEYPNKATVFFVPTTTNGGRQAAYTVVEDKLVYFKDLRNPQNPKVKQIIKKMAASSGFGLNGGRPIPPPNGGDQDFQ